MRYFLKLSYNGSEYHGWQRQDDVASIQQEIEEKLSIVFQSEISVTGCGRTDTGVHAKEFFAHFDVKNTIQDLGLLLHKLNTMLSTSIAIQEIIPTTHEAHARFDATKRSYEYRITRAKNPFEHKTAYRFNIPLNLELMNKAGKLMLGKKDFGCFCKANADNFTNICTVYEANWKQENDLIVFKITANRFLRNMVRAVVGTMLEIGEEKMELEGFQQVLDSKDRTAAGRSVPACGLYLTKVEYPPELFDIIP